ncbi:hypothetical protein [Spirosoma endophyticum]|uniref:AlgX/AlgJ SGNH hydrolase-like domain-containing protein n=1 Tax=Spirosoma endophyticum TaxID=662367 RepID=A0A1I2AYX9_9BACT|nr:hypothetical protein [Spirosoma endophyticum]SFE48868.1 hypothetical protein SAMN05216167_114127 [Spirosoma endophyticum]
MRIFRYLLLLFALVLWGAGLSSTVSHWLYKTGLIVDDYRFGDLYRLSALPQFKQKQPICPPSNRSSDTASTHLYLIGDSFSEPQRLSESDFRVSHFQRVAWEHPQRIQLDPNKRNVLLIESVERHFREHFAIPVNELIVENDTSQTPNQQSSLSQQWNREFHRKDVEERLESALFSHDWAFWIKEFKAALTLNWFDRAYTSVSLSKDKKNVFLHSDTDTSKVLNSSFSILTDREVNALVDSVNTTAERYQKLGFDEVYLSLIPNKASILERNRGDYNHLIERIQNSPRLKVPAVNTYDSFQKNATLVYLKSDTHWSCNGRAMWLTLVREKLGI